MIDKVDAVFLLSHNGMDVDLKLATRVTGIDVILGGHTHDAVPQPITVTNSGGVTLVTNAGSNGKFVGALDLELARGKWPARDTGCCRVYSELLKPDPAMQSLIDKNAANPTSPMERQARHRGSPALSPRQLLRHGRPVDLRRAARRAQRPDRAVTWLSLGATALAGQPLTMEDVLSETAISYGETYVQTMTGSQLRDVLEDVCDNLFNPDPYYQQGGDMVRVGGLSYNCAPAETVGKRISDLVYNGHAIEAGKHYKVAGWASVNEQAGAPVGATGADDLRAGRPPNRQPPGVTLHGVEGNPGIAGLG